MLSLIHISMCIRDRFGDVWIEFEPCDSDSLEFAERVVGGAVPKGFFPAVEKGLRDCIQKGTLAGYPMVGLKATLYDGSYHPVDSSEIAFKMAAAIAYKNGIPQASPTLLEPIGNLKASVPDANMGDVMGEINKRRGRVLGMNPGENGMQVVEADVPMAEMGDFATFIRQCTCLLYTSWHDPGDQRNFRRNQAGKRPELPAE